jgi:Flp pilus assembly pilin Flp
MKGLIAALIAIVATTLSTTGVPSTISGFEIIGIGMFGTALTYIAVHAVFPSTSIAGVVNMKDILTSLFTALGAAVSSFAASSVTSTSISWHGLLALMGTTFAGIIVAQLKNVAASATIDIAATAATKPI